MKLQNLLVVTLMVIGASSTCLIPNFCVSLPMPQFLWNLNLSLVSIAVSHQCQKELMQIRNTRFAELVKVVINDFEINSAILLPLQAQQEFHHYHHQMQLLVSCLSSLPPLFSSVFLLPLSSALFLLPLFPSAPASTKPSRNRCKKNSFYLKDGMALNASIRE